MHETSRTACRPITLAPESRGQDVDVARIRKAERRRYSCVASSAISCLASSGFRMLPAPSGAGARPSERSMASSVCMSCSGISSVSAFGLRAFRRTHPPAAHVHRLGFIKRRLLGHYAHPVLTQRLDRPRNIPRAISGDSIPTIDRLFSSFGTCRPSQGVRNCRSDSVDSGSQEFQNSPGWRRGASSPKCL